jgi:hypothetical protein
MKECPECSMFNPDSGSQCKYCGASLSGGAAPGPSGSGGRTAEDPKKKAEREKEEKRKKIITYAGYGVIAAALVGVFIYMQVKKSKEPPPPAEGEASQMEEGEEESDEAAVEEEVAEEEIPVRKLGDVVSLDAVAMSFRPFAEPVIEGEGDAAEPDPDLLFKASTEDGVIAMSVRRVDNPAGAEPPSAAEAARLQADYVLSKGKPVVLPGKKKGKSKAGPYVMFEADLGQTFERIYHVFMDGHRVEFLFSYPAADGKVQSHERLVHNIMSSVESTAAEAPAPEPSAEAAEPGASEKPEKEAKPEKPADKPETKPEKPAAKAEGD